MRGIGFGGSALSLIAMVLFVMASSLAPVSSLHAETLVLIDGAVIHGEIKALHDDVYSVETNLLGTLRVHKEYVRSIDFSGTQPSDQRGSSALASTTTATTREQPDMQAIQSRLMQIPDLFSMIQALQSGPEVQAVLADSEIMSAIAAGNYAALMNHPKIIALTRNVNFRVLMEEAQ